MLNEYFKREEFQCQCGCGFATVDAELLEVLTDVRKSFNLPVVITSGCRCVTHNNAIGGALGSKHTKGIAADFKVVGVNQDDVATYLETIYKRKYGIGRYVGRTHIDVRPEEARWDER